MSKSIQTDLINLMNVSRETIERLELYAQQLLKWNKAINLVSRSTENQIWERHILDSAQLWPLAPKDAQTWLDIGSGAGFPGLVLAVIAKEQRQTARVTLVESDLRKASFLMQVSTLLELNTTIIAERVENIPAQQVDVLTARALSSVTELLHHSKRHLADGGINIFLKGQNADTEIANAQEKWTFTVDKTKSITDPGGVILKIGNATRAK